MELRHCIPQLTTDKQKLPNFYLDNGAEINAKTESGQTPLTMAQEKDL